MSSRGRVCVYSEYLFPVLVPTGIPFAGGAETQVAKLVRGLQSRGFEMTVTTCDFGQPRELTVRGVRMLRMFPLQGGPRVLRFFHPRLTRSIAALREADADVYYVNGAGLPAGLTFDVAHALGAAYINHAASDYDVVRALPADMNARDRWWYRRAIRGADALLAQTAFQQRSFRTEYGLSSEVLANLVEIPAEGVDAGKPGAVVWLGTYKAIKRPHWFVRLAEALPAQRFIMAGVIPPPPLSQEEWIEAEQAARRLPNLEVRGFLDHARVAELFRGAALLVHTSPVEGFSNVLLEAWAHGLPTVSCVDPDGIVGEFGLGAAVTEFGDLVEVVTRLLGAPEERRAAGARTRAYVRARHAPDLVFDQLAGIVDRVIAKKGRRKPRRV
jgi:glycosyltransferase involved in cell wall biosynthesis